MTIAALLILLALILGWRYRVANQRGKQLGWWI